MPPQGKPDKLRQIGGSWKLTWVMAFVCDLMARAVAFEIQIASLSIRPRFRNETLLALAFDRPRVRGLALVGQPTAGKAGSARCLAVNESNLLQFGAAHRTGCHELDCHTAASADVRAASNAGHGKSQCSIRFCTAIASKCL